MTISHSLLPERLSKALQSLKALQLQQIYFAPVRHHSPACSYALKHLIEEVQPTHILIEAPSSFATIIDQLLHCDTKPPIAVLCQTEISTFQPTTLLDTTEDDTDNLTPESITYSAFYPFCHYSPEWLAMQMAKKQQANVQFIDLPWNLQTDLSIDLKQDRSLLSETYLKHSQYIQCLMQKLHCRDHDEVWEHLFELKDYEEIADWQTFFADTFIWCAMSRLDYSQESLAAEGSAQREQYMLSAIGELKKSNPKAKIVVVTGGFHTLALVEGLWKNRLILPKKADMTQFNRQQKSGDKDQTWLIRYSFDRLDALNGYASGMPSPAYYQTTWQSMLDYDKTANEEQTGRENRQRQTLTLLSEIADKLRQQSNYNNLTGFVPLKSAIEQAILLADLRGHNGPGRYDLLDAIQSCFIKESIDNARSEFWLTIRDCLSGNLLGEVPIGIAQPPLVNDVYLTLKKYRFKLDDTNQKLTHIDIYRKPDHRQRSRFLHLMTFLKVGFASRVDGPDYIHGQRLNVMFEDWRYAWTPMVEARLIELSQKGTKLEHIAISKMQMDAKQFIENNMVSASLLAVEQLTQAALMGLDDYFNHILDNLADFILSEGELDSLIHCGHRMVYLWQGQTFLQLKATSTLLTLLNKIVQQGFFLLNKLKQPEIEHQQQNLQILLSFRDLLNYLPDQLDIKQLKQDFYQNLHRLQSELNEVSLIRGAIDSISYLDSYFSQQQLEENININFSLAAQGEQTINYFIGIMSCAPELVIHSSILLDSLDKLLIDWSAEQFIKILPDLRLAFSQLNPNQNASLAEKIAKKYHITDADLHLQQYQFSENQLQKALSLELSISKHIKQQQLTDWFKH